MATRRHDAGAEALLLNANLPLHSGYFSHPARSSEIPETMADEDLIFRMEGLDNARSLKDQCSDYCKADSDEEDHFFICPITDDPASHYETNKKNSCYVSKLVKPEGYENSSSPRNSFKIKVGQ
ncbi:hypothetical protein FKM82_020590 [Ascaphus truei]